MSAGSELVKKAQIVLEKQPHVIDPELQQGRALHPEPEGEPLVLRRLESDRPQNLWMDHPGTQNFRPSRELAHPAPVSAAQHATDIDFRARLRKWEKAGSQSHLRVGAKERA